MKLSILERAPSAHTRPSPRPVWRAYLWLRVVWPFVCGPSGITETGFCGSIWKTYSREALPPSLSVTVSTTLRIVEPCLVKVKVKFVVNERVVTPVRTLSNVPSPGTFQLT